jgi:predicted DNA-binding transcriptional regulator AlpA
MPPPDDNGHPGKPASSDPCDTPLSYIHIAELTGVSAWTLHRDGKASDGTDELPRGQSAPHPAVGTAHLDRAACPDECGNDGVKPKIESTTNARLIASTTSDGIAPRSSDPFVATTTTYPHINTGKETNLMDPSQNVPLVAPSHKEAPPSQPLIDVLTVDRKGLAQMLRVSESTIKRLDSSDDIPGRCQILGSVRYYRREIERWVAEGCPRRADRAKAARARRLDKR